MVKLCTGRAQTGAWGSSENTRVVPYAAQGKINSVFHTDEEASHKPSYTCVNLFAFFLWEPKIGCAITSDTSFWWRMRAGFGTESKCQWLNHYCVFQSPAACQGKRRKRICDVEWVRMLPLGMSVSLTNCRDTIAKKLGKPGRVCCGCPGCLGDKSFIYLTWLVGKRRASVPCS